MAKYFVYYLIDPRDDSVFYVGRGSKNRIRNHNCPKNKSLPLRKRIKEIHDAKLEVGSEKVFFSDDSEVAYDYERSAIAAIGLKNLCNIYPGYSKGISVVSTEVRKKISESKMGENNSNYGKTFSKETRRRMSESKMGDKHWNHGGTASDETRRKMSKANSVKIIRCMGEQCRMKLNARWPKQGVNTIKQNVMNQ